MRVLIVDDLNRTRQSLKALLSTHPAVHAMREAGDGEEAVRVAESWRPDAVVMDVRMPGMGGLEATRLIKTRWPAVKVLLLSICGDYEAPARVAGADAFINKGEPPERLLQALDGITTQH